jgi:DNA-binding beta-propeller fold protein YncE
MRVIECGSLRRKADHRILQRPEMGANGTTVQGGVMRNIVLMWVLFIPTAQAAVLEYVASSENIFAEPHDVIADAAGKYLYVADLNHHVIQVLDAESLRVLGVIGQGQLKAPHDVAFDKEGRLLVADTGNDRIALFRVDGAQGEYVGEWREGLTGPEGVDVSPQGRVYVTNTTRHTVAYLVNGTVVKTAGKRGHGPGEFILPHDIEVGPDGRVYVGDPGNNRIHILSGELEYVGELVGEGKPFNRPKYLGFDDVGRLYVADQHNNQIRIHDQRLKQIAVVTHAAGKALNRIEGVYARGERVWVADTYNNRIVRYRWKD